jgi:cell wall-associated NlpC family hydrolase
MPIIQPRDLLCWNSRTQATTEWQPSAGNRTWRPILEYYPDSAQLFPGDILLFRPLDPGIPQKVSQWFQKSAYTHAAIYVGSDHEICEAIPSKGVVLSSLEDSLDGHCILARRVPNLTDDARERIAIEAGALRRSPYAFQKIFDLAWDRFVRGHNKKPTDAPRRGVICSTLCEHAILAVTEGALCLRRDTNDVITPARLADTPKLGDVSVTWSRVVRSS